MSTVPLAHYCRGVVTTSSSLLRTVNDDVPGTPPNFTAVDRRVSEVVSADRLLSWPRVALSGLMLSMQTDPALVAGHSLCRTGQEHRGANNDGQCSNQRSR